MQKTKVFFVFCFVVFCLRYGSTLEDSGFNWGTYKPQLIHAISQSQNNPMTISQCYFDNKDAQNTLRHQFPKRQSDQIIYNYRTNTGVGNYAAQDVFDPLLGNLTMKQNFIRLDATDWIDTTKNITTKYGENSDTEIGFIYSIAFEQFESSSTEQRALEVINLSDNSIVIKSSDNQYKVVIQGKNLSEKISYRGLASDQKNNWKVSKLLKSFKYNFNNKLEEKSTIIFVKSAVRMNEGAELQVYFTPDMNKEYIYIDDSKLTQTLDFNYQKRFESAFNINQLSSNYFMNQENFSTSRWLSQQENENISAKQNQYQRNISDNELSCAQQSFSNLMGGVQYSYGNLWCLQKEDTCKQQKPLFSTTPSRLGFTHPFLWDDGFHQMMSCQWDIEFCKQDIQKWFDTQSVKNGWIPREQPRGPETRSYNEFIFENNKDANPPSFLFNLVYIKSLGGENEEFVNKLIPQIEQWFGWWMNMQLAKNDEDPDIILFKWWGYLPEQNLGSGMDDWPRVDEFENKKYISKYNVDASAWAYFFSESLYKLSNNSTYLETSQKIKKSIQEILLNHDDSNYYDYLEHNPLFGKTTFHLSSHLGYPNFLPLIVGIVDDIEILEKQLNTLMNEETLWTPYGIRSISEKDEYFAKGSNYWRGPIWINVQFLLLRSMKKFYWDKSPLAQTFYEKLRSNVISTVCGQFEQRGYFFEHFNQNHDGQGAGNHPFNGWTSLITLIITESYI